MTRVLTAANLKGGTTKTTSVAFLAHALAERGHKTIVIDADPQGSALRWQGLAGWPVPVMGLASTTLHRQLWGVVDPARFDLVIIDTPPLEERDGIVASALRISTDVIVPMAPTMMELDRISPVWKAVESAAGHRDDDPTLCVLLTRVVPRASSTDAVRGALSDQGRHVLTTTIPRRESYAQAFGVPIPPGDEPYGQAAQELLNLWGER
jgi:chromosome partitioning protein